MTTLRPITWHIQRDLIYSIEGTFTCKGVKLNHTYILGKSNLPYEVTFENLVESLVLYSMTQLMVGRDYKISVTMEEVGGK